MEGWKPEDPLLNPEDPEAQAREQRRREREARRREREGSQGASEPAAPGARSADEPASGSRRADAPPEPPPETAERVPPPQERLPSSPGRTPLAGRVASMRGRLSNARESRRARPPKPPKAPRPQREPLRIDWLRGRWPAIVAVLAAFIVIWFAISLFQPFHGSGGEQVNVTIPKNSSAGDVGDILDDSGIVSSSSLFQIRIRLAGKTGDIQPGLHAMRRDETYGDAIDQVTSTQAASPQQDSQSLVTCDTSCSVTIPEGLSRAQIAPYMRKGGLRGSYLSATVHSKFLAPNAYGAQGRARNLEGFLFPDTFEVERHSPVANLVQLQLQDFKRRIKGVDMRYAKSKNLTTYDVLIIASMIDREVQVPRERPLVAAVIYNRLHDGIPLGIDATTRFAVGNYTEPLTQSQLNSPSPYNTRLSTGLPPGPIGNPGLAAIEAAARPAKAKYLYYVVKPGTCGEHNFSTTEAQFERDAAAYQKALKAKGSSPTSC
jgi:uncharacterized YceG family protein